MSKKKSENIFKKIFSSKKKFKINLVAYCKNSLKGTNLLLIISILVFLAGFFFLKNWFIVATVNYKPITRFTLDRALEKQLGKEILDMKINEMLIQQEGKRQKITISKAAIDEKIKEIEEQLDSQGQNLDNILATQGQTRKDLETELKNQILIEKLISKDIEITDEQIAEYFEENKESFPKDSNLKDNKEVIKKILLQQEFSIRFQPWLEELKQNAKINYFIQF